MHIFTEYVAKYLSLKMLIFGLEHSPSIMSIVFTKKKNATALQQRCRFFPLILRWWTPMLAPKPSRGGGATHQMVDGSLQPLGFFSRRTSPAETRYSAYDLELLAIYSTLLKFRHILEGRRFTYMDRPKAAHEGIPESLGSSLQQAAASVGSDKWIRDGYSPHSGFGERRRLRPHQAIWRQVGVGFGTLRHALTRWRRPLLAWHRINRHSTESQLPPCNSGSCVFRGWNVRLCATRRWVGLGC